MSYTSWGNGPTTLRPRYSRYVEIRAPNSRHSEPRNAHIPDLVHQPVGDDRKADRHQQRVVRRRRHVDVEVVGGGDVRLLLTLLFGVLLERRLAGGLLEGLDLTIAGTLGHLQARRFR